MKVLLPWQSPQTAGPLWFTVAEKLPSRTKATAATEDAQGVSAPVSDTACQERRMNKMLKHPNLFIISPAA